MVATKRDASRLREKPQQIADELRAMIVSGRLSEGDSLDASPSSCSDSASRGRRCGRRCTT